MITAGVDVWKGRWVVVLLDKGQFRTAFVADDFAQVMEMTRDAKVVGVDIPIGLPQGGERRVCDLEAKRILGKRQSSVFLTPSAELLNFETLQEANRFAESKGWPKMSAQTFGLKKQILAVAPWAEADERIFEVHPEVSFTEAGGSILGFSKSSWNGQHERRQILEVNGVSLSDHINSIGEAGAADLLDAGIVAWSANRIASRTARILGDPLNQSGVIWA